MRRWDGLVERHIWECEQRGLADTTRYSRRLELDKFGSWLKRRRPKPKIEEIDSQLCLDYLKSRTIFLSKSVVCSIVTHLRGMGDLLVREGYWVKSPMRWIRGPKIDSQSRLPRRVGKEHLQKLWEAAYALPAGYRRHRVLAVMGILYGTGIRRGELVRLDLSDWDRARSVLKVDGRKTGCERLVPIGAGVWRCIEAYLPQRNSLLEQRGKTDEAALFVNKHGERVSGDTLSCVIKRLCQQADVPVFTLHQFRHSCASDLLDNGVSLPEVQQILGHSDICNTMRYTHISGTQRADAVAKHPINSFLNSDNSRRMVS